MTTLEPDDMCGLSEFTVHAMTAEACAALGVGFVVSDPRARVGAHTPIAITAIPAMAVFANFIYAPYVRARMSRL